MLKGQETFSVFQQKEKIGVADVDEAIDLAQHKTVPLSNNIPWVLINTPALATQYLKSIYGITATS